METKDTGFTLIELSIVLIIIGLIVGGVLVGRDLIRSATVRAQISQIQKYQQAVNTFRVKYGYLPGDIPPSQVSQFGFSTSPTRAGTVGQGDGNGELDGFCCSGSTGYSWNQNGELLLFWEDLSSNAGLISGNFSTYVAGQTPTCGSFTSCAVYIPSANIGRNNNIYVYSGEVGSTPINGGPNYFGLAISGVAENVIFSSIAPAPGLSVSEAYTIDKKVDDGLPQTGNIKAQYLSSSAGGQQGWASNAASSSPTTCFDTSTQQYSITQNNGLGLNCALSFKIQ